MQKCTNVDRHKTSLSVALYEGTETLALMFPTGKLWSQVLSLSVSRYLLGVRYSWRWLGLLLSC